MTTRRILLIGALTFAAGCTLMSPASADDKAKSCTSTAAAACALDPGCDPECCALLADFCCAADAATKLDLTDAQAADVKSLRKAACDAVAPHAKNIATAKRELREAAANGDAATARARASALAEATAEGLLAASEYTTRLVSTLTPEQRAKLQTTVTRAKQCATATR
jgi:Spy/CpxP family protein refolding chaperone